ncbi:MAG TPA: alpha/beta fold hydrolase [Acidimicrobiales bacterium]|nr:alpha/beta fold hydrolase [Acidimicrobiales bacterium]
MPVAREHPMKLQFVSIHGHDVGYRTAGSGPVVVLIHGMAGSSATWRWVAPALAEHYTVVAPDLLGHGRSAKPRGDYSLGAYACGIRDLLVALGHERATIVGQSLGGGVAMQFAYLFPQRVERLVLVGSGGLGQEVSALLRVLSLPGAEVVLPFVALPLIRDFVPRITRLLGRAGLRPAPVAEEMWRAYASLADPDARLAFVHTLRSVVDVSGQRVSATDRLYLAAEIPTLLVWGDQDPIIPVEHARRAHADMPGSRLEIFEGAGHFPHCEQPERFVRVLTDFLRTTRPRLVTEERWQGLLTQHLTESA